MSSVPKTIQIFLPSGDPRGIRISEITTRIVQVIEVPRSLLPEFLAMPESKQVAVYFLFGTSEEGEGQQVYIGQTGDIQSRLRSHNANKDFWERALVLISKTNSLTQTHALFLEWHCLQMARRAGRYADENGNSGSQPYTPAPMEADCHEIFDTGKVLLASLGFPLFNAVSETATPTQDRVYTCTVRGAAGRGIYTSDGFVVLEGSSGPEDLVPSLRDTTADRARNRLIESGVLIHKEGELVFTKDQMFSSPSLAGATLIGRAVSGWECWKTDDGRTLHDIERAETDEGDAEEPVQA